MTKQSESVSVFAPATVANVGSAFDVLGFALEAPGDTVTVTPCERPGVHIVEILGCTEKLPMEPDKNTASVSVQLLLHELPNKGVSFDVARRGIEISIHKGLPIGSGLGSSSASTVAAVVAANYLFNEPFSRLELLPFAMEGERVACGSAHADNVAPALLGGFTLVRSYSPLEVIKLPSPSTLYVTCITPDVEVKTSDARRILKTSVLLKDAISQWGNVAALVAGIFTDDVSLIGRSLEDKIIEPERAALIPGFYAFRQAACAAGALGFAISGSGPTMFAISGSPHDASRIQEALAQRCKSEGITGKAFISRVNPLGAVRTDSIECDASIITQSGSHPL